VLSEQLRAIALNAGLNHEQSECFRVVGLVAAAACLLSYKFPLWEKRINTKILPEKGVLEQLFGSHDAGTRELGLTKGRDLELAFDSSPVFAKAWSDAVVARVTIDFLGDLPQRVGFHRHLHT
jgi:hypothetical protein